MLNSPCKTCTTRNPRTCNGWCCNLWRYWWINTWDTNRLKVLAALTKKEERNENADKSV